MADAPVVREAPRCDLPGCGMVATGSSGGINHCGKVDHEAWARSPSAAEAAEAFRQRPSGPIYPESQAVTGYTCRCGWMGGPDSFHEALSHCAGNSRCGQDVFERIGRGSLRAMARPKE